MESKTTKSEAKPAKSGTKKRSAPTTLGSINDASIIYGIGKDPNQLTVLKSNPLYGLWRSELGLVEFKIIDTYLARIDSHNPARRTVRLKKGEIEQLLGVEKINRPVLEKQLKNLGTMVPVDDPRAKKGFQLIALFQRIRCEQDDDGLWQVDLTCTTDALKYVFNVDNLGYLRYKLRSVTSLQSRYSYILFLYLEKNRHMHRSWEIPVDELRMILKADNETYQEFKYFNGKILKPAHKEITEKTECSFTYEPIKQWRRVKTIRFTLAPLTAETEQRTLRIPIVDDDYNEDEAPEVLAEIDQELDDLSIELSGACNNEFNVEELQRLKEAIIKISRDKLPILRDTDATLEDQRYWYCRNMYKKMCRHAPKRRFNYLLEMIEHDTSD